MILYRYYRPERVDVLENRTIVLSRPKVFNDPFEFSPTFEFVADPEAAAEALAQRDGVPVDDKLRETARELMARPSVRALNLERLTDEFVVYTLSETKDSVVMWAHYADCHRGFQIGFYGAPKRMFYRSDGSQRLFQVSYQADRPTAQTLIQLSKRDLFFTKSIEWEYEREWRLVDSLYHADGPALDEDGNCWPFALPAEAMFSVTFGCRTSNATKARIMKALDQSGFQHVKIYQARVHDRHFRIEIIPVRMPA